MVRLISGKKMNLIKKIDGYYFRGYIPAHLQLKYGKKTQDKKLYTKNKKTALKLVKNLKIEFEYNVYLRGQTMAIFNREEIIKDSINKYVQEKQKEEEQRLYSLDPLKIEVIADDEYYDNRIIALSNALNDKSFDIDALSNKSFDFVEYEGAYINLQSELKSIFSNLVELTKDEIDFSTEYLAKKLLNSEKLIRKRLIDGEYTLSRNKVDAISPTINSPMQASPVNVVESKKILKLVETYENYMRVIGKLNKWSIETTRINESILKALFYYFGDIDVNEISQENAIDFRDAFKELPAKWMKDKFEHLTNFDDILKENEIHNVKKLSTETLNKRITSITSFFKHSVKNSPYGNPFEGLKYKKEKKSVDDKKKKAFKEIEIDNIFQVSYYTSRFDTNIKKGEIAKIIAPILSLYSGMRLNELSSLYVDDIKKETINNINYYYFDINRFYDKVVKSNSSLRHIPIHYKLIELGLIEYIQKFKKGERIFPKLKKKDIYENENINDNNDDENPGRYGGDINRWFASQKENQFKKFLEEQELKSFHSFRHNFADKIYQQGNGVENVSKLLGHYQSNSISINYTQYQFLLEFTEYVNRIEYDSPNMDLIIKKVRAYIDTTN